MKTTGKFLLLFIGLCLLLGFTSPLCAQAASYKFNMSYIYFGSSAQYTSLVDDTQNSLDEVAPNYFTLASDGSLVLTGAVDLGFVSDMHERGIDVVPYLTNDWSRARGKAALDHRQALAEALAAAVDEYNLDGVNIDLENLTETQRDDYVDFTRQLRALMPDKTIAVAVAANPDGLETGWQGSYDYTGLAEYCDYLFVLAYDEHYFGGPAGPIASYNFLERSLRYAIGHAPSEKIVLGFAFYGRIWSRAGGHPNGYGLNNATVERYVRDYGGYVTLDASSLSAQAVITLETGDVLPVIGGQTLKEGTYTIWFENEDSIKAKLDLVSMFGIRGTGSWSLGQEPDATWDYYKLWLNNCTFRDVETNWAKDYILEAHMNGWISGTGNEQFNPDDMLTRAEAATLLVRRLGLTPRADSSYAFSDCAGSWARDYIETARKYGLISGVGGNRFAPDRPISRQELAVLLNNALALGIDDGTDVPAFSDVSPESNPWSYDAVEAIAAAGILSGDDDGAFHPGGAVTRAEMTQIIVTMPTPDTMPSITPPSDSPEVTPVSALSADIAQTIGLGVLC